MFVAKSIQSDHKDLIHDVSFDFHGTRMATCSSDQCVKRDQAFLEAVHGGCGDYYRQLILESDGCWEGVSVKACLQKANNTLGQIIWDQDSSNGEWKCSASWRVHSGSVWRVTWAHPEFGQVVATCSFDRTAAIWEEMMGENLAEGEHHAWIKRASLVDSRTAVTDVKFAPKHLGFLLATCSTDGIVRVYEAPDVMNLSQWSLQHEISCKLKCSCLSWNTSRRHPAMLAVGSDDPNPSAGGKVQIYEYNDATRKWNKVETIAMVTDAVHDVAFAPNLGRSYHLLAVATKTLKVISIEPLRRDGTLSGATGLTRFELRQVGDFPNHDSQVWRVCWNVLGTVLVSSGDDSCVRMWKGNYLGNWKCIAVMKGDGTKIDMERNQSTLYSRDKQTAQPVRTPAQGVMNIRRSEGWPKFTTNKDQGNVMM